MHDPTSLRNDIKWNCHPQASLTQGLGEGQEIIDVTERWTMFNNSHSYFNSPSEGLPCTMSETTMDVSPLLKCGLSFPPETAIPKPWFELACKMSRIVSFMSFTQLQTSLCDDTQNTLTKFWNKFINNNKVRNCNRLKDLLIKAADYN